MATIRKLRGRWQAQVRRRGLKPRCKSFDTKIDAEKWARDLEAQVDRCGSEPDTRILDSTTLGDLLERYKCEVSPTKRGSVQEVQRLGVLQRHGIAQRTLMGLSQVDISTFRDERLRSVSAATTLREHAILSHVLEVAIRDWGYPLSRNVGKLVRRPIVQNERKRRLEGGEEQRWREVPRDREVIIACAVGVRSLKATYYLMYQGYEHVENMKHGMARWLERGFPVVGNMSKKSVKAGSACGCGDDSSQSAWACCSDKPTDPKSESGCGASTTAGSCC